MWNDVELLANDDTSTVRVSFDLRRECGSALYQVDNLVKLSCSEKVLHNPDLYASYASNYIVVVADRTVVLFDYNFQSVLLHLNFGSDKIITLIFFDAGWCLIVKNVLGWSFFLNPNVLSVWEVNMLVMVWCWPELAFHDFLITTEGRSSSVSMSLVVYSLPSMTALYSLEVSSTSALVKMGVNMDTVYLLEGISKSLKSPEDPVSSVVVRCFTEALPENRLSRLLHKHKFEEAETFAIQFGLDVELVYKVKLDFVLEKLASSPSGGYGQEVFSELVEEAKTNLAKINDEHFVVQYSVKAPWPTFSTAQEMLNHANSRYPCSQIQEALSKLATFCGLNGPEKFNGISWIEFLQSSDYIIDILWHLRDGDLRGAQYLWLRNEFDEKTLDALLSSIPKDVPSKDLCPWFRTIVIPFIRKTFPKGQKKLSRWLEQRARNLELTEKADWPQNGLEMAQLGLPSFWLWLPLEDDCGLEEVEQLRSLVQSLRQLLDLFNKYHCKLSLSDFEKRNTRSIVFLMLDKVLAPELIPSVIESSVRPYTQEHRLHLDELLLHYIRDMLERCSSQTTSLFTEWEAKAMAVLDCMTDSDVSNLFLPRVVYLLQMYPMDFSSRLLSSILTAETWPLSNSRFRLTFCHRARALLCVVHIADPSTLETLLHIPRDKVQYYLKCYIHLAQLEGLNIPYTVDSFLNSPKEGLIKGLWKNHSHEPEAVRLVSDLCLEYQVFDPQLWNGVLQKLLTFNMISYLQKVLEALGAVPSLLQVHLHWPFLLGCSKIYHSGGTDHNLSLFYHLRCPFLLNMDLIGIAKCFTQVNLPCFSLGSLLLISCTSKKERNIQVRPPAFFIRNLCTCAISMMRYCCDRHSGSVLSSVCFPTPVEAITVSCEVLADID
uniref:Kinetochore associated 1 n=1 Tax=Scleropages formosus TaxID=113540 RepID=A0A8C9VS95_SCLFO